jgi:hypothetical protein
LRLLFSRSNINRVRPDKKLNFYGNAHKVSQKAERSDPFEGKHRHYGGHHRYFTLGRAYGHELKRFLKELYKSLPKDRDFFCFDPSFIGAFP